MNIFFFFSLYFQFCFHSLVSLDSFWFVSFLIVTRRLDQGSVSAKEQPLCSLNSGLVISLSEPSSVLDVLDSVLCVKTSVFYNAVSAGSFVSLHLNPASPWQ